jgi:hypothetical protein
MLPRHRKLTTWLDVRQRRTVLRLANVSWAVDLDAMADEAARTEEAGGGAVLTDGGGRLLTSACLWLLYNQGGRSEP